MSTADPAYLGTTSRSLYGKLNRRVLPFLLLCYAFAYLDRVNVGFAQLQMKGDLGFSDAVYGLGAGMFFLGYVLFEIPSNLMLPKVGARRTVSRIMVLWGMTSACMLFVHNAWSFYVLRFLLGVFEAGFFPGMVFYLTYWYSDARMARAMAVVMLAGPIGGIVGGPLSTTILTTFNGAHGLAGWQWMFVIEGLPCVLLGIVAWFRLADGPNDVTWLSADEKRALRQGLHHAPAQHHSFAQVLKDPRIYLMAFAYFCLICGIYAISFWLPTILKSNGVKSVTAIGWYSAIPYIFSAIGMHVACRSSDRLQERRLHSAIPAFLAAIALAAAAMFGSHLATSLICMTVATMMIWIAYTVFWAMPSSYLKGESAAGGMALINTIGLIGGFISPTVIGWIKTITGSMQGGLYFMVCVMIVGSALLLMNRIPR